MAKKIAILSGATKDIGKEVTLKIASQNYDICLLTHNIVDAEIVKTEVNAIGCECYIYPCKVEDDNEVDSIFSQIYKEFGRIDIVFTNMGLMPDAAMYPKKDIINISGDEWRSYFNTALMGVVNSTKVGAKYISQNKEGGYIFNTALWGLEAQAKLGLYSVSRGAIKLLCETVNVENPKVRCYLLSPTEVKKLPMEVVGLIE